MHRHIIAFAVFFLATLFLSACKNTEEKKSSITAITNKSSPNCLYTGSNGETKYITDCKLQGKLILTSPTDNLSYVLYRKDDTNYQHPVLCTLPAQAAEALTQIRKGNIAVPIPKGTITAGGEKQDNSNIILLNKDDEMSPSLYVLSSNFALCMSYGSNAINENDFAKLFSKILDNAVSNVKNQTTPPKTK